MCLRPILRPLHYYTNRILYFIQSLLTGKQIRARVLLCSKHNLAHMYGPHAEVSP